MKHREGTTTAPRYLPAGDSGVVVEFGNQICPAINDRVRGLHHLLQQGGYPWLVTMTPTYRSLLVEYDPLQITFGELKALLEPLENGLAGSTLPPARTLEIPTCYGGNYGPDLPQVADHTGLPPDEVIRRHAAGEYRVYMLGFSPGFPFLGGMDPSLETPRLERPRTKIPGGSVGIAGGQTGVYPLESPGGWQLIGRTPLRLYDPRRDPPILPGIGDTIRFRPISEEEFHHLEQEYGGTQR